MLLLLVLLARQKAALSAGLALGTLAIKAAVVKFVKGFYVSQRRDYNCFMRALFTVVVVVATASLTNYYHK